MQHEILAIGRCENLVAATDQDMLGLLGSQHPIRVGLRRHGRKRVATAHHATTTTCVASPASAAGQHKRTGRTSVKPDVCCKSPPVSALAHRPTVMHRNAQNVGLKGPRAQTLGVYSSFLSDIGQECKHPGTAGCSRSLFSCPQSEQGFRCLGAAPPASCPAPGQQCVGCRLSTGPAHG